MADRITIRDAVARLARKIEDNNAAQCEDATQALAQLIGPEAAAGVAEALDNWQHAQEQRRLMARAARPPQE